MTAPTTDRRVVTLVSSARPWGLPREAELPFDLRFLPNPRHAPALQPPIGIDCAVGASIATDSDFPGTLDRLAEREEMLLPSCVQEGKKCATVAIGCTGGHHRSVYLVEKLASRLIAHPKARRAIGKPGGRRLNVMRRGPAREGRNTAADGRLGAWPLPAQAQEA